MFGKLPAPKYLAHTIFKDNAAGSVALAQGEVDVSQQFNSNIQVLWLNYGLPISTYLPEAPYGIGASLPTAFFNKTSYGLDQLAVRKAIAIAVDYPTIIANAMTNQSATFAQVPRSLMNPTPGEQALYDHNAVKDLQWVGNDIAGAKALLDAAGIIDTDGDGWREYNGQNLPMSPPAPMAGPTGRLRSKWLLPLEKRSGLTSRPTTLNGLFTRPLSPTGLSPDRL